MSIMQQVLTFGTGMFSKIMLKFYSGSNEINLISEQVLVGEKKKMRQLIFSLT